MTHKYLILKREYDFDKADYSGSFVFVCLAKEITPITNSFIKCEHLFKHLKQGNYFNDIDFSNNAFYADCFLFPISCRENALQAIARASLQLDCNLEWIPCKQQIDAPIFIKKDDCLYFLNKQDIQLLCDCLE